MRHINKHRPGAAAFCNVKSFRQHVEQLFCRLYHCAVLADWHRKPECVSLLKCVCAYRSGINLPRYRYKRHRIRARVGNRRQKVHCARSACSKADSRFASYARGTLRHKAARLFLSYKHMLNLAFGKLIIQRQNHSARNAENRFYALAFENLYNYLCAGCSYQVFTFMLNYLNLPQKIAT